MGGFFGWFLVIVGVLAIFNAEKLPALRQMLDEKLKGSLDAAKEVSKTTKNKIEKVKTEIDNRKNAPQEEKEAEEDRSEVNFGPGVEAVLRRGNLIWEPDLFIQNSFPNFWQFATIQTEDFVII